MKVFEYDGGNLNIDIHGSSELPLFPTDQIGSALWIREVEQKISSFESDEVVMSQGVLFLTESGLLRLLPEAQSPWASAFIKWAFRTVKEDIINEKRVLETKPKREAVGSIYILRNKSDPRPRVKKIGRTLNVDQRVSCLGTGTPDGIEVEFSIKCVNNKLCEKVVHSILDDYRIASNKEWFTVDLDIAVACVQTVVYVTDGLIRNMVEFTEGNVTAKVKRIFDELEQASPGDRKRQRLLSTSNVTAENVEPPCVIDGWLQTHLAPISKGRVHLHRLLKAFSEFMTSSGQPNFPTPSTKILEQKLRAIGYKLTKSTQRQRDNNCDCNNTDRFVENAVLKS